MKWSGSRRAALVAGALAVGLAASASADVDDSRKCRIFVGKDIPKVTNLGLKGIDKCYKLQHKAVASVAPCLDLTSQEFDPTLPSGKRKYVDIKSKAETKQPLKCLAGDPVLANYQSGDPYADNVPLIEETIVGNTALIAGLESLGNPDTDAQAKIDIKCIETIEKNRTKISRIWVGSQKCQKLLDDVATSFGPLDDGCLTAPRWRRRSRTRRSRRTASTAPRGRPRRTPAPASRCHHAWSTRRSRPRRR